jgi:hypothetical protein
VLICTLFLTIALALFNKFNVDLALRAFETETHYVAQAADVIGIPILFIFINLLPRLLKC